MPCWAYLYILGISLRSYFQMSFPRDKRQYSRNALIPGIGKKQRGILKAKDRIFEQRAEWGV